MSPPGPETARGRQQVAFKHPNLQRITARDVENVRRAVFLLGFLRGSGRKLLFHPILGSEASFLPVFFTCLQTDYRPERCFCVLGGTRFLHTSFPRSFLSDNSWNTYEISFRATQFKNLTDNWAATCLYLSMRDRYDYRPADIFLLPGGTNGKISLPKSAKIKETGKTTAQTTQKAVWAVAPEAIRVPNHAIR